ncbi:hypothetical protein [Streptomyces sp. NPDC102437]|uniref:hypothetical protein n=1 Tax=Streptomyces sp. NPDC102437 TaxID=3366175 RepID=UPI00381109CC
MAANSIHQQPVMAPEQREVVGRQVGDVNPATDELIVSFAEAVANRRDHAHPEWEDLFCANLSSYMGERVAPVLRRLMDAEAERDALRAQVAELESLQLGAIDGRMSATCDNPEHPTWLRAADDTRGCPWCRVAKLETAQATTLRGPETASPHDSPLHHGYALGRDLPKSGGAS